MEEKKKSSCRCRWKNCKRHGDCAACTAHHKSQPKHKLPYCMKKKKQEK